MKNESNHLDQQWWKQLINSPVWIETWWIQPRGRESPQVDWSGWRLSRGCARGDHEAVGRGWTCSGWSSTQSVAWGLTTQRWGWHLARKTGIQTLLWTKKQVNRVIVQVDCIFSSFFFSKWMLSICKLWLTWLYLGGTGGVHAPKAEWDMDVNFAQPHGVLFSQLLKRR